MHLDMIAGATVEAADPKAGPRGRDTGVNAQPRVFRAHAENPLYGGLIGPGSGPGKPAIAGEAELRMLVAENVLGIDVRLALEDVDTVVLRRRVDLVVVAEGALAIAEHRLGDNHPGVGVQEDTAIF